LKEEHKGKWLTAGFDVDPKTLEYIKKGTNFTGVDPEHFLKGYLFSTAVMIRYVRRHDGKLPKGWFPMPGQLMTPGNIDEIITREKSPQAA
jgi:ABC-type sugar transport system substrate-binding protein